MLGRIAAFSAMLVVSASPALAEGCRDYFSKQGINRWEYGDYFDDDYVSWNGGPLQKCVKVNLRPNHPIHDIWQKCGDISALFRVSSYEVRDKSGNIFYLRGNRDKTDTIACIPLGANKYAQTETTTWSHSLPEAGATVVTKSVNGQYYNVIKANF